MYQAILKRPPLIANNMATLNNADTNDEQTSKIMKLTNATIPT
jgi:hypothetical protein